MSPIPNALWMTACIGTKMPNRSQLNSSRWPGAGWKGKPKASPNTRRPSKTDQSPPTAVTKKRRNQMDVGFSLGVLAFGVHVLRFQRGSNGVESLFGQPAVDHERVIAHCEPQGGLRLVDLDLEQLLRGDHESGVFLAQCLQATAKLFEPCPPLLAVGEGGIEQFFGIRFARRDVDLGEAELAEHV